MLSIKDYLTTLFANYSILFWFFEKGLLLHMNIFEKETEDFLVINHSLYVICDIPLFL